MNAAEVCVPYVCVAILACNLAIGLQRNYYVLH